ncbi:unnamed protein product [Rhizophagus irregularis]|nr:unnamed protein product [Rhizophagus irregularis]
MDENPKNLWENTDISEYQRHVTIPTIDSTIGLENVDERVVYIGDLEKRKQAYGICGECGFGKIYSAKWPEGHIALWDIENQSCSDTTHTSYAAQSTSANSISECLDVQLSELELNEICQDGKHNIE